MRYSFESILANDPLSLLKVVPKFSGQKTEKERLVSAFEEINEFFVEHQRVPIKSKDDIIEFTLACRLLAITNDHEKQKSVRNKDKYNLLTSRNADTVNKVLQEDQFGLLDDGDDSIFELTHVPSTKTMQPDYIAGRKKCRDFGKFSAKFDLCKTELAHGLRKLVKFKKETSIEEGEFFVLNGVLLYVATIGNRQGTTNPRLRCIFSNGMESDMLLRSLASGLYKNGNRVIAKESGYLYVVKSASTDPKIASLVDLYKIGYSKNSVERRLRNAKEQATYLYAPVKLIDKFKCYNINPQKLEYFLHNFFAGCCLDLQVNGHSPREWFVVPLLAIEQAVDLLIDGSITDYWYSVEEKRIVKLRGKF